MSTSTSKIYSARYVEFEQELGVRSLAGEIYEKIIYEATENFKKGNEFASYINCETLSSFFNCSPSCCRKTVKRLRDKGFIQIQKLDKLKKFFRCGQAVNYTFIPLKLPKEIKEFVTKNLGQSTKNLGQSTKNLGQSTKNLVNFPQFESPQHEAGVGVQELSTVPPYIHLNTPINTNTNTVCDSSFEESTELAHASSDRVVLDDSVLELSTNGIDETEIQKNKNTKKAKNGKLKSHDIQETMSLFEKWYTSYPRRDARVNALKAFLKAIKKISFETLMQATAAYAKLVESRERDKICMPASWLNGERWNDENLSPFLNAPSLSITNASNIDPRINDFLENHPGIDKTGFKTSKLIDEEQKIKIFNPLGFYRDRMEFHSKTLESYFKKPVEFISTLQVMLICALNSFKGTLQPLLECSVY
jgi:hypothetical protein